MTNPSRIPVAFRAAVALALLVFGPACARRHPAATAPPAPVERPAPPPAEKPAPEPGPAHTPRLTPADSPDVDAIRVKLDRVRALLAASEGRDRDDREREQVLTIRGFVVQAEAALAAGEPERAAVLAEKALLLAQDWSDPD